MAGAEPLWLALALVTAVAGLACAARLERAGHPLPGLLACALTGLLVSPISWDHHWVWIVPGVAVAATYAVRAMAAPAVPARPEPARSWPGPGPAGAGPPGAGPPGAGRAGGRVRPGRGRWPGAPRALPGRLDWRRAARWPAAGYWGLAAAMLVLYGAWPGRLWGEPHDLGQFSLGVLWQPPNTDPEVYYRYGDRPWFAEYHWHGIELLTGNAFLLGGLALLAVLIAAAMRTRLPSPHSPTPPTLIPTSPTSRTPTSPSAQVPSSPPQAPQPPPPPANPPPPQAPTPPQLPQAPSAPPPQPAPVRDHNDWCCWSNTNRLITNEGLWPVGPEGLAGTCGG